MEIFKCFQFTPSNLSDFVECSFLLQYIYGKCGEMKLLIYIVRYMHVFNLKKNAQIFVYYLEYLNIGHCVELIFL